MARWLREWARADEDVLRGLMREMMRIKPRGWSLVPGAKQVVLRPPAREIGKFTVMHLRDEFRIHFFDRSLNHWAEGATITPGPDAAAELLAWAEAVAAGRAASAG